MRHELARMTLIKKPEVFHVLHYGYGYLHKTPCAFFLNLCQTARRLAKKETVFGKHFCVDYDFFYNLGYFVFLFVSTKKN